MRDDVKVLLRKAELAMDDGRWDPESLQAKCAQALRASAEREEKARELLKDVSAICHREGMSITAGRIDAFLATPAPAPSIDLPSGTPETGGPVACYYMCASVSEDGRDPGTLTTGEWVMTPAPAGEQSKDERLAREVNP